MWLLYYVMEASDLDDEQQKKYEELKKKYLTKSKSLLIEKEILPDSHSEIITSLEKQLQQKRATLDGLNSNDLLSDLENKKKQLDDNIATKKQYIQDLRSNLQILQKEIMNTIQEIKKTTEQKTNELYTTNNQISELSSEEKELVEKIQDAQKLRASQEKELESIRLERLNIVNKNKYPQKIPSPERWGLIISPDQSISSEHFNQN